MIILSQYARIHVLNPISCGEVEKSKSRRLDRSNLKTYTCIDKAARAIEHILPSQVLPLSSILMETYSEPSSTLDSSNSEPSINDLSTPIVVRKGVGACTKHPISNFVSYY